VSNKKKILVVKNIHEAGLNLIKENSKFEFEIIENPNLNILKEKIIDCDAIAIKTTQLTSEVINIGKKVKIISRHGVGYDNIDLNASKKNNITVSITTTANAVAVSEHVMFMLLSISKRKSMYDKAIKSGKFNDRNKLPKTLEIWGKNILIIGFGRIGKCLSKRCLGFEMNVYVYDPYVNEEIIKSFGGKKIENLNDSIKDMDVISLHVPSNHQTKNMINFNLLKKMKKNCIIINASRGGIINEIELNKALNENLIFGAGLDVFDTEPPNYDNPLLKNDKTFLSPHTASFTEECMIRMSKETIQNIFDFFNNKLEKSKIVKL